MTRQHHRVLILDFATWQHHRVLILDFSDPAMILKQQSDLHTVFCNIKHEKSFSQKWGGGVEVGVEGRPEYSEKTHSASLNETPETLSGWSKALMCEMLFHFSFFSFCSSSALSVCLVALQLS